MIKKKQRGPFFYGVTVPADTKSRSVCAASTNTVGFSCLSNSMFFLVLNFGKAII